MKPSLVFLSLALLMTLLGALCIFTGLNAPLDPMSFVQIAVYGLGALCTCIGVGLFAAFGIQSGKERKAV